MPFTLAHPAAVLCLPQNRFLHRSALTLGAMSPDFIYFLQGKAANGFGHTLLGALCVNLPLVCLCYALYGWGLRAVAMAYLPQKWAFALPETFSPKQSLGLRISVFLASALLGMATHVFWDAFTHANTLLVSRIDFLNYHILTLPVFKWLQYGGGVGGLAYVMWVWRQTARRYPAPQQRTRAQKQRFGWYFGCVWLILMIIWQCFEPVYVVATQVIRMLDCGVVLWLLAALRFRYWEQRHQRCA